LKCQATAPLCIKAGLRVHRPHPEPETLKELRGAILHHSNNLSRNKLGNPTPKQKQERSTSSPNISHAKQATVLYETSSLVGMLIMFSHLHGDAYHAWRGEAATSLIGAWYRTGLSRRERYMAHSRFFHCANPHSMSLVSQAELLHGNVNNSSQPVRYLENHRDTVNNSWTNTLSYSFESFSIAGCFDALNMQSLQDNGI